MLGFFLNFHAFTYAPIVLSRNVPPMQPKIIDADTGTELWTAIECATFSGTARGTFTSYAGRGRVPKPVAKLHGLTLWDSNTVREWTDERREKARRRAAELAGEA